MKLFFYFLIIFLIFNLFVSVYAQNTQEQEILEIPPIPMYVKGDVYITEKPAPTGTKIVAKIENEIKATFIISEKGKFALPIPSKGKDSGKNIIFYVNDIPTNSTLVWRSGDIIDNATLYVTKKTNNYLWIILSIFVGIIVVLIIIYFLTKRKKG